MPKVEIGPKRHRVTIETLPDQLDAFRQLAGVWTAGDTVWARVRTLSGREAAAAHQVRPETSLRVEMRYRSDISPEDRLDFSGRKLKILAAFDPEERGRVLYVDCCEWPGASTGG